MPSDQHVCCADVRAHAADGGRRRGTRYSALAAVLCGGSAYLHSNASSASALSAPRCAPDLTSTAFLTRVGPVTGQASGVRPVTRLTRRVPRAREIARGNGGRDMQRVSALLATFLVGAAVITSGVAGAEKKLRVVATIPDLTALAQAVGGNLVEVETLTRGTQNAHEAEVRPTMMLKLRRADALVENGLELDTWADVAVNGANNPNIVRGAAGRIDISRGLPILEVPTVRVDRSMGDVHPLGNPHYSLDPGFAPMITQNIVDGLSRIAGDH